jgi:predicted metal-dependent HD superfamily phosphohydrolase
MTITPSQDMLAQIVDRYFEINRYYHNVMHITRMEDAYEKYFGSKINDDALYLSLWLHDVVYVPGSNTNEEDSVNFFLDTVDNSKILFWPGEVEKISNAIMSTKTHNPSNELEQIICDLDLEILSADKYAYDAYASAIRAEYSNFSDEEYIEGRKKFLDKMLWKDTIYYSEQMKHLEPLAHANLLRELKQYDI